MTDYTNDPANPDAGPIFDGSQVARSVVPIGTTGTVIDMPDGIRIELPADFDPEVVRQYKALAAHVAHYPGKPIDPATLNISLLVALGVDPETASGARLTIQGGVLPILEVWNLPPNHDGEVLDGWAKPIAELAADATFVMLPGADSQAPPAKGREPLPGWPITDRNREDFEVVETVTAMADALNGAYIDSDTRDLLTQQARRIAGRIEDRIYSNPTPNTTEATTP